MMHLSRTTLVYIAGHGYSGSTLLTLLLNAHPSVATVGEAGISPQSHPDPATFHCSCAEPISECPFWRRVTSELDQRGFTFDIRRNDLLFRYSNDLADRLLSAHPRGPVFEALRAAGLATYPKARRRRREFLALNEAFVQVVTGLKGGHVFVDSSKRPERALHLRHLRGCDLKVIHIVRDGRAVANSCRKNLGITAVEGARSWVRDLRSTHAARPFFEDTDWMTLRYEDMCGDVSGTLSRVFDFIGVAAVDVSDYRSCEHHVIGNRMRLSAASDIRVDESWRSELQPFDRDAVDALVASINAEYGYAPL